jgi:tyrosinase
MSDVYASPSDPLFWMHHSFVDHAWWSWQKANAIRVSSIDGVDTSGNALTLNTIVTVGGIRPDVTLGTVINTQSGQLIGGVPYCFTYSY